MNLVVTGSYWYDAGYKTAKTETIKAVLEIIDEENDLSKLIEETPLGYGLNYTLAKNIKNRVSALKGEQSEIQEETSRG